MCCVDVCVKESSYERESGERKVSFWSVGQLVERLLLPLGFFKVPFAPKVFFLNQLFLPCASFVSFSHVPMFLF